MSSGIVEALPMHESTKQPHDPALLELLEGAALGRYGAADGAYCKVGYV